MNAIKAKNSKIHNLDIIAGNDNKFYIHCKKEKSFPSPFLHEAGEGDYNNCVR